MESKHWEIAPKKKRLIGKTKALHLGIKDTGIRLDNRNRLVESLQCNRCPLTRLQHNSQIQFQLLRLQLRRKLVLDALALTSWNLNVVAGSGQIAHDSGALRRRGSQVRGPERSTDEDDGNGFGFFVGDGKNGLGGLTVDELDAEDFGRWERGGDFDGEVRGLRIAGFLLNGLIGEKGKISESFGWLVWSGYGRAYIFCDRPESQQCNC